jgi:hypothetical protein
VPPLITLVSLALGALVRTAGIPFRILAFAWCL